MEHEHAYAYAAAALCDQVERALEGGEGEAERVVVEAELANVCVRLGCRGTHPLEWRPEHLEEGVDGLREDDVIEAYLLARVRLGLRGRLTKGGRQMEGPLSVTRWQRDAEQARAAGPKLWEGSEGGWGTAKGCQFSRALAAAGTNR